MIFLMLDLVLGVVCLTHEELHILPLGLILHLVHICISSFSSASTS